MAKSLLAAISSGVRPGPGIKASLQSWLGVPITPADGDFWRELAKHMGGSWSGKPVSVDTTLQLSTAWACVRLISQTIATLPCGFYTRQADGSKTSAADHSLYNILHNQPNADTTAVQFWQIFVASMLLQGVGYAEKAMSPSGTYIAGLKFLMPTRTRRRRLSSGKYEYKYLEIDGKERPIPEERVMRVPAFALDEDSVLSPIAYGCNVFGSAAETDKASADTFTNAMRSPGLVMMDTILKKDQREEIRQHVKKVGEEGGVMVLEKGAGFEKLSFDPVSAELLSSREWNVEEIARWFGVDPSMIGHGSKDSNWGTGLEQKMLWFITFTLRSWCVRIEQAIRKDLLTPVERTKYFAEFAIEGLLRGDSAARAAFYSTMTQNGIMTRDQCRALENWPQMGGNAAVLTVQSNLLPIDALAAKTDAANLQDALKNFLELGTNASKESAGGVP